MPVTSFLHDSRAYVSVVNAMLVHSKGATAPGQRQMLPLTVPCFLILFLQVSEIFLFFNKGLDFKQALSHGVVTSFYQSPASRTLVEIYSFSVPAYHFIRIAAGTCQLVDLPTKRIFVIGTFFPTTLSKTAKTAPLYPDIGVPLKYAHLGIWGPTQQCPCPG